MKTGPTSLQSTGPLAGGSPWQPRESFLATDGLYDKAGQLLEINPSHSRLWAAAFHLTCPSENGTSSPKRSTSAAFGIGAEIMDRDPYDLLVQAFLKAKRIAIWGVEDGKGASGQMIVAKFRKQGIQVIAVNPKFSDDASQQRASSLTRLDPPAEAVLVYVDRPQTMEAVDDCIAAKVPLVWLHDALSPGAAIPAAIDKLRSEGCSIIPGLCPMFYLKPVDPAHFCLGWILRLAGKERRTRHSTR